MKQVLASMGLAVAGALLVATTIAHATLAESEAALRRFVEDYRTDPMLVDARFGVKIGEDWWTVRSTRGREGQPNEVQLDPGQPGTPTWYYAIESAAVLDRMDRGAATFGTLAGKERPSDRVPVDADFMPGFAPGDDFYDAFTGVSFHFWYRGNPEIVPFASQEMRVVHGVDSTALYYQPGLRVLAFSIRQGQRANQAEGEGVGPWKKLFVFTRGAGKALIDERQVEVKAGDRLFVPPKVVNRFWNDAPMPLEGVLIIFGEGA